MDNLYLAALRRNLDELQRAKMAYICIQGFETHWPPTHLHAKLFYNALFNDHLTKCMKVFEIGRQAASIWYLNRRNPEALLDALGRDSKKLNSLESIARKLKVLRDKAHFHIDEQGVLDVDSVWRQAAIDRAELSEAVDIGISALRVLAQQNDILLDPIPHALTLFSSARVAHHLNLL